MRTVRPKNDKVIRQSYKRGIKRPPSRVFISDPVRLKRTRKEGMYEKSCTLVIGRTDHGDHSAQSLSRHLTLVQLGEKGFRALPETVFPQLQRFFLQIPPLSVDALDQFAMLAADTDDGAAQHRQIMIVAQ